MNNYPIYDQELLRRMNEPACGYMAESKPKQDYNARVLSPYEGFIRGNMFADLYDPYYSTEPYQLTPQNEQEALLNKYRMFDFACTDIGLYLDTHPDDGEMIKLWNQYRKQADQWKKEYETRYGPLTQTGENMNVYPWAWNMSPWPWEGV